jgi:ATP-binding cassette, subfamily C (CFTR/MRP), member 1
MVIAQVALIASGSVYMTATIPVMLAVIFFLQNFYLRTSRQLRFLDLEAKSPLYSHFLETLNGLATIRAFRWGRDSRAESLKLLDRSQRPYYLLQTCQKWLELVLALIVSGEAVLIVGIAVGLRRFTDPGLLGVSLVQIMCACYFRRR